MNDFQQIMSEASNEELIKIVTLLRDEYQPEAVATAEAELKKRNLPQGQFEQIRQITEFNKNVEDAKASEPLSGIFKVLCFLFPFVGLAAMVFIAMYLKSKGYRKKGNDVAKWTLLGALFYCVLCFILFNL